MDINNFKNYSELSPSSCICLIIRDIINNGVSRDWHGKHRDLSCLKRMLTPIHVKCTYQGQNLYFFEK